MVSKICIGEDVDRDVDRGLVRTPFNVAQSKHLGGRVGMGRGGFGRLGGRRARIQDLGSDGRLFRAARIGNSIGSVFKQHRGARVGRVWGRNRDREFRLDRGRLAGKAMLVPVNLLAVL